MASNFILLDVSGRQFKTLPASLKRSPYFRHCYPKGEDYDNQQLDGSYFIDADPDTFQHVLNFMRRPSSFPLFWTRETGFDYTLYNKLEAEADHFSLHDLSNWIRKKRYIDAVKVVVEVTRTSNTQPFTRVHADDIGAQVFFGSSGERSIARACRNVHHHDDDCAACDKITQAHGPQYNDPPKSLTIVTKRVEFDHDVCVNDKVCKLRLQREEAMRNKVGRLQMA